MIQHLACPDDAARLVDVEQTERVVAPVEQVSKLVVRREIAVTRHRRPHLRPKSRRQTSSHSRKYVTKAVVPC